MLNVNDAMNFALSEKYKIISLPQALKNLKISNDSQGKGKKSFVLKEMNALMLLWLKMIRNIVLLAR
jgi:hypothetical protein